MYMSKSRFLLEQFFRRVVLLDVKVYLTHPHSWKRLEKVEKVKVRTQMNSMHSFLWYSPALTPGARFVRFLRKALLRHCTDTPWRGRTFHYFGSSSFSFRVFEGAAYLLQPVTLHINT